MNNKIHNSIRLNFSCQIKSEIKYYTILLLERYNATFLLNPFIPFLHSNNCYQGVNIEGKCSYSMPLVTCLTMAWQKKNKEKMIIVFIIESSKRS